MPRSHPSRPLFGRIAAFLGARVGDEREDAAWQPPPPHPESVDSKIPVVEAGDHDRSTAELPPTVPPSTLPSTDPEWAWVTVLFERLLTAEHDQRERLLDEWCAGRPEHKAQIHSLLRAHEEAGDGFLAPIVDLSSKPADDPLPSWLGPYQILHELGRGGMARVYLAERSDDVFRKQVAVKVARAGAVGNLDQLVRERQVLADLEHPNIARILDGGSTGDGQPYLVMEHVDGAPIDEHCEAAGLDLPRRLELFAKVCRAVQAAHNRLVLHGDLKPANVLVTEEGEPKVIDFGASTSLRDPEPSAGATPGYSPPEQMRGESLTASGDVYALGGILMDLLIGDTPRRAPGRLRIGLTKAASNGGSGTVRASEPRPLRRLPKGDLGRIVRKATALMPVDRYGSAQELVADVERFIRDEPTSVSPQSLPIHVRRLIRRNPMIAGGLLVVLLAAAWVTKEWQQQQVEGERRAAVTRRLFAAGNELVELARRDALLPVHPRAESLRFVAEERARLAAVDDNGTGATSYAVGCADYALGRYRAAQTRFEAAMTAGFEPATTGLFLARTLFHLYREELAQHHGEPARKRVKDELDARYRAPAQRYLAMAGSSEAADTEYLGALTAFYEERYQEALERAREVAHRFPWLYEAKQLEAESLIALVRQAAIDGDGSAGDRLLSEAGEAYAGALEVGRSDPALWAGECSRRRRLVEALVFRQSDSDIRERVDWAAVPCATALAIDPGYSAAELEMAQIYWNLADSELRNLEDPASSLARAEASAHRVRRAVPGNVRAYRVLANSSYVRARWLLYRGEEDPLAPLDEGERVLRAALRLEPENPDLLHSLANLYYTRVKTSFSEDDLAIAAELYGRAAAIDDQEPRYSAALGALHTRHASYLFAQGASPEGAIEAALEAIEKALALKPDGAVALGNRSVALLTRAEHRYLARTLTAADLEAAHRAIETLPMSLTVLGADNDNSLAWVRAAYLLDQGKDPSPAIAAGLRSARRGKQLAPTSSRFDALEAHIHLLSARHQEAIGQSPLPGLDAALASVTRAEAKGRRVPLLRAEIALRRAQWRHQRGRDPRTDLEVASRLAIPLEEWSPRSRAHAHLLLAATATARWQATGAAEARSAAAEQLELARGITSLLDPSLVQEMENALE